MMKIDYLKFVELLKKKEGEWDSQKVTSMRNIVSTISLPGCPLSLKKTLAKMVNEALGQNVISMT